MIIIAGDLIITAGDINIKKIAGVGHKIKRKQQKFKKIPQSQNLMKAAFHYLVKAKLIRKKSNNELDFEEISKIFETENPIIAREEAFDYFQTCIDILLQHKGKEYISDKETRKELVSFFETETSKLQIGEKEILFTPDSLGNGIGVYFVKDFDVKSIFTFWNVGEEALLYGIGNLSNEHLIDDTKLVLKEENEYYHHYGYNTKGYETLITYCSKNAWLDGIGDASIETHKILKTPFDWKGYDKPYWWGQPEDTPIFETKVYTPTFEDIINGGESNSVEFKPALLYNFKTKKAGIGIKEVIAKAICAFLNSRGGMLFIGVDDNGKVQGLNKDFELSDGKKPKDYFLLEFDQMLEYFLGSATRFNINGQFINIDSKEIFVVSVEPSSRPIFLKGQHEMKFFIRGEASSRRLTEISELINYCLDRFSH